MKLTVPEPVPEAGDGVSHGTLLNAVQAPPEHGFGAAVIVTLPLPPPDGAGEVKFSVAPSTHVGSGIPS